MRCVSRSTSENARPCTPPQKSWSLSGRSLPSKSLSGRWLTSPSTSLSGRLTPPTSASQVVPQASPSNTQQEVVEEQEAHYSREPRSASSARRSLERSWSDSLEERQPIVSVTLPQQDQRKPTIPAPVPVVHSSTYLKSMQRYAAVSMQGLEGLSALSICCRQDKLWQTPLSCSAAVLQWL
eukprot:1142522-Pelagomonas_calceolata.AAC.1